MTKNENIWIVFGRALPRFIRLLGPKQSGYFLYIGPDTAVSHLAAATGCPTVALFGPMDPRVWGPWPVGGLDKQWLASKKIQHQGNVWIVQNPMPCLPCTFEGCERHIESYSRCLDELSPAQVLAAVDEALGVGASARSAGPQHVGHTPLRTIEGPSSRERVVGTGRSFIDAIFASTTMQYQSSNIDW